MSSKERKVREFLKQEIEGAHGMEERRVAARFVLEQMEGKESDDPPQQAANIAQSLQGFCRDLAGKLSKIK